MEYTGRITSVMTIVTAILIMRIYAYIYLDYPLTAPPVIGVVFLCIAFWGGRQYDKVKFFSEKDGLTGCYNRRFIYKTFPSLLRKIKQKNESLSIVVLDCNNFKTINDKYGHVRGDRVLQEISILLLAYVRDNDIVVRWGGDEFLIIAPCANGENINIMIKRLEEELQKLSKKLQMHISVASGYATYPRDAQNIDDLIQFADRNMYLHKQKNRESELT